MMDAIRYPVFMRAKRGSRATVSYPTNMMPRNNLIPVTTVQGAPPELRGETPRYAHTHSPNLSTPKRYI